VSFDRSEFAHLASLGFRFPAWPRVTRSCDKLQNQNFKDRALSKLPGNKKLNLGADFKVRVSRRSFHCRDKIELQSEVPEVEELNALFGAFPLVLRDEHFSDLRSLVN
jgi:hypothetical protein